MRWRLEHLHGLHPHKTLGRPAKRQELQHCPAILCLALEAAQTGCFLRSLLSKWLSSTACEDLCRLHAFLMCARKCLRLVAGEQVAYKFFKWHHSHDMLSWGSKCPVLCKVTGLHRPVDWFNEPRCSGNVSNKILYLLHYFHLKYPS